MAILFILIFLASCFLLVFSAKWLIDSLTEIARFLGWKEFVVAFFTISLGAVIPEFFIGVISALNKVPELAFGSILGQNILLFSFTVGICAIILKSGIEVESKTVRAGSTFAVIAAILPLILILDGQLSKIDGVVLLLFFFYFIFWLFSKKERFTKIYEGIDQKDKKRGVLFLFRNLAVLLAGFLVLLLSAKGIVESSLFFKDVLNISLSMVGILIVAIGVGLPETYFSVMLARKGQSWMILGGLMGAVAMSSTLVLGVIAILHPITLAITPSVFIARVFLVTCALLFLFFVRTEKKISTREGVILLSLYAAFIILEILVK